MPASSLIFLAIVALWGAYLVPAAIRRRRAVASARIEDRDSENIRVVVARAGSAPVVALADHPAATLPALPAPSSRPMLGSGPSAGSVVLQRKSRESRGAHRAHPVRPGHSGPSVVRRRRRLLALTMLLVPIGIACAAVGLLPWWLGVATVVAPAGLIVLFLRQPAVASSVRPVAPRVGFTPAAAEVVVAQPAAVTVPVMPVVPVVPAQREHTGSPVAATPTTAAAESADPEPVAARIPDRAAWAPVPVPLPTYLLKPKAEPVLDVRSAGPEVGPAAPADHVIDLREPAHAVTA